MSSPPQKSCLLLIDIQAGFAQDPYWGNERSNPSFESNVTSLINSYRSLISSSTSTQPNHKIIHVQHSSIHLKSPLHPSSPGMQPASYALPLDSELPIHYKTVNSAFIGTPLSSLLASHFGTTGGKLYIVGLTTDHCVSTSVRMASNLYAASGRDEAGTVLDGEGTRGEVVLVGDATATWDKGEWDAETVHRVHIASLKNEFARIVKTKEAIGEWEAWSEN